MHESVTAPPKGIASKIRDLDWASTELGPQAEWPISLRTVLATMLACPTPMFLAWGPKLRSFYNDAYEPILGYRAESALGMPFRELWASIWDDIAPLVDTALSGGQTKVVDMRLDLSRTGAPEESYWTFTYSPAFDDDGAIAGMICVTGETTDRVLAERERQLSDAALRALNETLEQRVVERTAELQRAEERLRQSQKMEAVGQLTGGLAHDFNNLLTGISGSLEMIAIRIGQGRLADVEKYNLAAQTSARRAAALTHRLLAFSRRQTLDPKAIEPNRLIQGMIDLIGRTVGPQIDTRFVPGDGIWTTLVDPPQLENALLNLSINARDAMPDGGTLTIETSNRTLDGHASLLRGMEPGSYVALCVSDTGTGMTPEVIAKAFDPFFTTKPIGVGTGLGLSMIYGFVQQSGGQVRIHSVPGEGTTVCVYLPRHRGQADADEDAPDPALPPRAKVGETVLVVDDEAAVRMLVTDLLEELGYTAIEAVDGASGLRILQSGAPIDLLVSDVGLPGGMNGRQMADAARVQRPELKVLFITGYAENAAVGAGLLAPGMHVMTKPFAMEALATRIRTIIEDAA